jgi:hypothetical protein
MNYRILIKFIVILFACSCGTSVFSQLEFTKQKRLLFVGADSIEGKRIIAGAYITPIDSFHLDIKLDLLNDWVQKDSIHVLVEIDTSSIHSDCFTIAHNDIKYPAYRFYTIEGVELFVAKELKYTYKSYKSDNETRAYIINFIQLVLPINSTYFVKSLPLMFNK